MKKMTSLFLAILLTATLACAPTHSGAKQPDSMGTSAPVPQAWQPTPAPTAPEPPAAAENGPGVSLLEAIEQSAQKIAGELPKGSRVAIVAFESENANLSDFIMEELTGALADRGIEVADRQNMEYLRKEFEFQMSGNVNEENAKAVGKFLAADMVITGQLLNVGNTYRYRANAIHIEQSTRSVVTRIDVRNDAKMRGMAASLANQRTTVKTAKYGSEQKVPQTVGTFLDRGILLASRGDYKMAVEDFTEALKLNPNMAAGYALRARARIAGAAVRVNKIDANFGNISVNMGWKLTAEQTIACDLAISDLNQAARIDSQNSAHYRERGRVYSFKKEHDKAMADYNQAIRLDINSANAYCARGEGYRLRGDFDSAMKDFMVAISLDSENAGAYVGRGNVYFYKGAYDMAIDDYSTAILLDPNYADAYERRGSVYQVGEHDYTNAIADYSDVIRLNPKNADAYHDRGYAYYTTGNYDKAIDDFEKIIRLNPKDADAYHWRANAYSKKGNVDRAISDYSEAIRLDPKNVYSYSERGDLYFEMGDDDKAIADYKQAIRLDPKNNQGCFMYSNRGMLLFAKGDYENAIADLNQVIRLKPNDAKAYYDRGNVYYSKGDNDRAIADCSQAIRLDSKYVDAYGTRARAYLEKGAYDKAIADYNEVIRRKLNPKDAIEAHLVSKEYFGRGCAYASIGNYDKAIADFNQTIKLNPNDEIATQYLEQARQIRGW